MSERLFTVPEVGQRLTAKESTVRGWLRRGLLKGFKPAGDRLGWRVRESELERFLSNGESPPVFRHDNSTRF